MQTIVPVFPFLEVFEMCEGVAQKKEVLPLLDCSFGRSELHGRSFLHVDQNCTDDH